ncbi:hypothetical protein JYT20_01695, partial [Rhodothermus sp. AH-315-K08]|nr:hypothetical protein [Rhodothermus sp. AH-315-K08]
MLSACSRSGPPWSDGVSTAEDREALFDQILESTLDREAFSPAKIQRLHLDVAKAMIAVRREFIEADTDEKLFYAIVKLSNTRKDQHLSVRPLSGGLWPRSWGALPDPWEPPPALSAPLRFAADFGNPGERLFFVADVSENLPKDSPLSLVRVGDRLLEVNGRTLNEYVAAIEPYTAYSTVDGLWWNLAERLNEDSFRLPAELRSDRADYVLESGDGSRYRISLAYQNPDSIQWANPAQPRYVGFDLAYRRKTFNLYVHTAGKVLLLDWFGFDPDLVTDVDSLIRYAAQHRLLNHDVILDATRSGGGSRGAYALQHLSGSRFRTTFGNVRLSDVTSLFV